MPKPVKAANVPKLFFKKVLLDMGLFKLINLSDLKMLLPHTNKQYTKYEENIFFTHMKNGTLYGLKLNIYTEVT